MLSDFASGQDDSTQCRHCGVTVATHLLSCPSCGASRSDPLGWYPPMAASASARLPAPQASVQPQLAAPAAWNSAAGVADDEFYARHNPWREPKSSHKLWFMVAGGLLLVAGVAGAYLLLRPERVVPKAAFGSVTTQQATPPVAMSSKSAVMAGTAQPAVSMPSGPQAGATSKVVAPPKLVEAGPANHKQGEPKQAELKSAEAAPGLSGSAASKPEVQSLAVQTGPHERATAPAPLVAKPAADTGGAVGGPAVSVQAGAKSSASGQTGVTTGPLVSNQLSSVGKPSASNQAGVANGPLLSSQLSVVGKPSVSGQTGVATGASVSNQASIAAKPLVSTQASVAVKPSVPTQASVAPGSSVSVQVSAAAKPSASTQVGVANGTSVSNQASVVAKPSVSTQAGVATATSGSNQVSAAAKPSVTTQAAVATRPSGSNQTNAVARSSVTTQGAAATGPSVSNQASVTPKPSGSNQVSVVTGPSVSNQVSAATKPSASRQASVSSNPIATNKPSALPLPTAPKSREASTTASRGSASSLHPTVVAKRDAQSSAEQTSHDVNRNLQLARAMLAKDDVSAARSHLTAAFAAQPKNQDAQSLDATMSAREQERDAVLQAARNCELSGRWICAWHNAGTAIVIDSGSVDAKRILSHAMQEAEDARAPAPAPVVQPPRKLLPYHH